MRSFIESLFRNPPDKSSNFKFSLLFRELVLRRWNDVKCFHLGSLKVEGESYIEFLSSQLGAAFYSSLNAGMVQNDVKTRFHSIFFDNDF